MSFPRMKLTFASPRRIIGFLLGLTAVGGYGYLRVLDDYRQASEKLLTSVEELKISTEQVPSSSPSGFLHPPNCVRQLIPTVVHR